jgi:PKD repeat protein
MKYAYIICILLITLLVIPASADWLTGYDYRKSHNITGNSTWGVNQTYYQQKMYIYRSTGTDSGNIVYVGTKCQNDYDDIRFTTSDGTTLMDYWIESSSSALATVWVEIPSIYYNGNTNIYIYYGNAGASAVSSGLNTFRLYDDFSGASLNTTLWTSSGTVSVGFGYCTVGSSGDSYIRSTLNFTPNVTTYFASSVSGLDDTGDRVYGGFESVSSSDYYTVYKENKSSVNIRYFDYSTSLNGYNNIQQLTSGDISGSISHFKNSTVYNITVKDITNTSYWYASPTLETAYYMKFFAGTSDPTLSVDYVYICNDTLNKPIHSDWTSEESSSLTAAFSADNTSIATNEVVAFTDSSAGYITNWSWDLDGDDVFDNTTEQNPSFMYTIAGSYNVSLYVNNTESGDWENKTFYINVGIPPVANFTGSPTSGEVGQSVSFLDASTGGTPTGWNWSFGDSTYSELQNPTHTFNTVGNYTIQLNASNTYGFDWENKTEYIQIYINESSSGYGTQYPPLSIRWMVKDYYGNSIPGVSVNATPTGFTSMGTWDWLKWIYGVNQNANLRYYSLNGVTGSDGTLSMLMLDTVEYDITFTNTTAGISQTFTMYPKGPDEYIYLTHNRPNQTSLASVVTHNMTTEYNSNNTYTVSLYYNDTTTNTQSLDFFVRNTNGTNLYTETIILPTNESRSVLIPYHEGQAFEYGFNATTNSFGEVDYIRSDIYYPEKVDIGVSDTWLQWISVSIIILFGAIFSRGNTSFGVIIVPVIAGLLIYMGWLSLSMMSSVLILLILGVLIYIKERYRRDG